jgi:hypothetical protein
MSSRSLRLALHELPYPPLSAKEVGQRNGKALLVWCALQEILEERNKLVFTIKSRRLSHLTGIGRKSTLSSALTCLNNAGWLYATQHFYFRNGIRKSYIRVVMLRNIRNLPISKRVKETVWLPAYEKLYAEQPADIKACLDTATHIWLHNYSLVVALAPDSCPDVGDDLFDNVKAVGPYTLHPTSNRGLPFYAYTLSEKAKEAQTASTEKTK